MGVVRLRRRQPKKRRRLSLAALVCARMRPHGRRGETTFLKPTHKSTPTHLFKSCGDAVPPQITIAQRSLALLRAR